MHDFIPICTYAVPSENLNCFTVQFIHLFQVGNTMLEFALLSLCLAVLVYYLLDKHHHSDEPPGPRGLPILGNLIDLARASDNMVNTFGVLGEKYGEIFSIRMGFKRTVVLTSKEAMQTVLSNEATFARDNSGLFADWSFHKNLGIGASHGSVWTKTRNWTFKTLREFGFGKSLAMEGYIQIASDLLFAKIDEKLGTEVNVDYFFHPPIQTTMWLMIVGRLSEDDQAHVKLISEKGERFMKSGILGPSLVNAFPFLRYVFPNWLGYKVQMDFFRSCTSIGKQLFDEMGEKLKASPLTSQPANLLEAFVQNCGKDDEIFNICRTPKPSSLRHIEMRELHKISHHGELFGTSRIRISKLRRYIDHQPFYMCKYIYILK
ncbi:Farnesoate epoxidase [Folsomia candida]|uniref:Farnesoate epoxidase n=1 Tax=Folsomia candida TaxID=158441 RepID=A0A226DI81_FOLCA|nr:Farnesoate epoxidase [Folsomia candida]